MEHLKVLYILHVANNSGSVISLLNLITEISKRGIQPIVVYPQLGSTKQAVLDEFVNSGAIIEKGIVDQSAFFTDSNLLKRIYHNIKIPINRFRAKRSIDSIIRKYKPDIIHTNSGIAQIGFSMAKKYNIPHVWHIREYLTKDFNKKLYPNEKTVRDLYGHSYTICITKDIQSYFLLDNNTRSRVIYNPIFSKNQLSCSISPKKNYFFVASRIGAEKGIDEIIDSFIEAYNFNNEIKLLIAGEGPEKEKYLKKYEMYISQGIIEFLGFINDVRPYMLEAKALLVGSRYEGFGRMTAEANMMGCMVIGRNSAGTKEILTSTKGGFLYNDKEDLKNCILQASNMTSDETIEFMRESRETAINLYNNEKSAQEVLDLYYSIVKK